VFLLIGGFAASHLKSQFFPEDVQYWFYLDIWLPNDVPLSATNETAMRASRLYASWLKVLLKREQKRSELSIFSLP